MIISCEEGFAGIASSLVGELLEQTLRFPSRSQTVNAPKNPFSYCVNTSTIRERAPSLPETIDLVADVGYQGIEPWISELDAYVDQGGDLADLKRQLGDCGLAVPNLIGFFEWGSPDPGTRSAALEEARRNMEIARALGCTALAAPPKGIVDQPDIPLLDLAERYGTLVAVGREYGVTPILEFWGHSKILCRLGEALLVAAESGAVDARILGDVFHMYKGGGTFEALKLIGPQTLALVHMNDYPAKPSRSVITDAQRVFPGDGVAPLDTILADLVRAGYVGMLSLELFNPDYWQQEPRAVLEMGLAKMKGAVASALGCAG